MLVFIGMEGGTQRRCWHLSLASSVLLFFRPRTSPEVALI